MNNIALGQYLPLNSIVHRMDPRAKIAAMLIVMIAIFIPAGYSGYAVLGIVVCAVAVLARLRLSFVWRAMRPMLFMLVFLLIVNLLVIHEGYVLFSIGSFRVYSGAVSQTLYIVIRLALMVTITTILTATTKPLDLTLGIEDLLKPFQKIGLPAHEIAMMISIALRFIPTLIEETQRIMKAQASRGVDLENGSIKEKVVAILSLLVPLLVSAWDRAVQLADALEAEQRALLESEGRYLTGRFSPGYGDWPITVQPAFMQWLDAGRQAGICSTASCVLTPGKSITALCGAADHPVKGKLAGCATCALRETCTKRKEGKPCAQ